MKLTEFLKVRFVRNVYTTIVGASLIAGGVISVFVDDIAWQDASWVIIPGMLLAFSKDPKFMRDEA